MKIRTGFVSNSSSSSSKGSAANSVLASVLAPLFSGGDSVCNEDRDEFSDEHKKLLDAGWKVYMVFASDEDLSQSSEAYLCHNGEDVEIDLDDVKIVYGGGY